MPSFESRDLLGTFVFQRLGLLAKEAYRWNIQDAIVGGCDNPLHNKLANVGAGTSDDWLNERGLLPDESLISCLDSMHRARLDPYYSDDWYWSYVLHNSFRDRIDDDADHADLAKRLYAVGSGFSDRIAFDEGNLNFCYKYSEFRFRHSPTRDGMVVEWTPVSIRLYEEAGIEPHFAVVPAKRGGEVSTYRSQAFREEWAIWEQRNQ